MVKFTAKSKYSNLKLEYLVKTKLVAKLFISRLDSWNKK